ncbi:MAG TPA: signal recognition particle subunit SRP19/SEC65 family protein [Candidatus Nitrosopolaris sp.]|nr:signal recognition particle subunit SRP19/SEC65 family protein [Candidatus Nitrosopolaris sp.]
MKDYDHIILWLDYFNKTLPRRKGRRIRIERAVFDPTVTDLMDAAKEAGYEPLPHGSADQVRYPRRSFVRSGYIVLPKSAEQKKSTVLDCVAEKMRQKSRQKARER